MQTIKPENFRHLEEFVDFALERHGFHVQLTGQEYRPDLGRWSPDRYVSGPWASCWVDVKLRNRDYPNFLIEHAEIERHCADFRSTAYVLVADNPLEIIGWCPATVCREKGGPVRSDHVRPGSGDPYRLVPSGAIRPWSRFVEWFV